MKNGLFLFPDLQENTDTSVVLEFMKIKLSDKSQNCETEIGEGQAFRFQAKVV